MRCFSGFAAAVAGLLLSGAPVCAAEAAPPCTRPVALAALLGSFGVNTHFQQGWQYDDVARTVAMLKDLGVLQIRDAFTGLGHPGLEHAAQAGIRFDFVIAAGWGGDAVPALEAWERRYPGSILAIEGPNEVNNWPVTYGGQTGVPAAQAFQRDLYQGVHASPVLRHIPVLALTSWPVFPNKSDLGNVHAYARSGGYVTPDIRDAIADEKRANPPVKPIWLTEAGYHTHHGQDRDVGVSEVDQAKMILSLYMSAFGQGVDKTFLYQLLDQYTDPNDEQSYFGIIDGRWRTKPAYGALKTLLALLAEGQRKGGTPPQPLALRLDGLPETASSRLFQGDGGDWLLVVWNEPPGGAGAAAPSQAAGEVSLVLGEAHARLALFDPLAGTTPVAAAENADRLSFAVRDHPMLIRIARNKANGEDHACTEAAAR